MRKRLHGWSLVAATLAMLGSPAVVRAGGPYSEGSEERGSDVGSSPAGPVDAKTPVPIDGAEHEPVVTTVTTVTPEPAPSALSPEPVGAGTTPSPAWSGGTVVQRTPTTTVRVETTVRSPYAVRHHHHHHHWSPGTAPQQQAQPQPQPQPQATFSLPRYAAYPYADGAHGHIQRVPWPTGTPAVGEGSPPGRLFAGQVSTESATAGKGVLRVGAKMRLSYWRLAADGDISYYLQRSTSDAMYIGTANVLIAPILRPRLSWWVGGGANYMIDAHVNPDGRHAAAYGYNLTSSIDVFPVRPLVLSGRMDMGRLGEASVLSARATAGLMMGRFEVYGGYELKRIGDQPLRGPMFGLRVWF